MITLTTITILLALLYTWVCRESFRNLRKGSAHLKQHPKTWLEILGGFLSFLLGVIACWYFKTEALLAIVTTFTIVAAPFFLSSIAGRSCASS